MAKPGPAPRPTAIHKFHGSWRGNALVDEPEPSYKCPRCPQWLRKEARRAWKEIVPQLRRMGVLGECDRNALARYCQTWAKYREVEAFLVKSGNVYTVRGKAAEGEALGPIIAVKEYPQVATAIRFSELLLKLEREFGLTPSARRGLAKPKVNVDENRGRNRFFDRKNASA